MAMFYYRMPTLGTSWGVPSYAPVRPALTPRPSTISIPR